MHHSREAFWWSLFSAGGVMSALFIPAFMIVTGVVIPRADAADPAAAAAAWERIHGMVSWWPVRIAVFAVLVLSLFHCAHRIRHILIDVGLRSAAAHLAVVCYGGALVGSGAAGWLLWSL